MSKKNSKRRVWRGVTTATASLLALSVCASTVVDGFRTDIDKFLGTKSTKLVTEDTDGVDLYTFKSDYTSTTDLLHGIQDVGERMSEEGSVLLKNNGALPLTKDETQKITLLGFSSYYPVQGGDMGSSLSENTGTDADTVDMVQAFKAKGFGLNQTVADMYEALQPTFKSEVQSWGGVKEYNHITAPSTSGVFSSKEPSQAALDGQNAAWKDSMNDNNVMIVTIARSASENGTYQPGTAGVDPTQNLNQTDPLGLSDDERDLIQAAVDAKASNGGKVIVLLNNASAMEVQEIQDNAGVDAILQIGLPGGYGFYGVADILSGDVNPSGHLTDTYAVKNANSPAAQNFGDLQWTNANPDIQMNDAIVEAENIYIGYKYYETRYFDTVMNQGNASSTVGSSTGSAWNYDDEVTYPFGYGLSYTTFTQTLDDLNVDLDNETVTAKVTVTNTGSVAGKDVVQLYVSLPYTDYDKEHGVEKAAVQLLDYGKTAELAPGASETVTITADMQNMASWDSTADNAAGTKGCYILDAGDYYFTIGNGAHEAVQNVLAAEGQDVGGNADKAKSWNLGSQDTTAFATTKNGTAVENQLADMDVNYWLPGTQIWFVDGKAAPNLLDRETLEKTPNGFWWNKKERKVLYRLPEGRQLSDLKIELPANYGFYIHRDHTIVRNFTVMFSWNDGFDAAETPKNAMYLNCLAYNNCGQGMSIHDASSVYYQDCGAVNCASSAVCNVGQSNGVYKRCVLIDSTFEAAVFLNNDSSALFEECLIADAEPAELVWQRGRSKITFSNCVLIGNGKNNLAMLEAGALSFFGCTMRNGTGFLSLEPRSATGSLSVEKSLLRGFARYYVKLPDQPAALRVNLAGNRYAPNAGHWYKGKSEVPGTSPALTALKLDRGSKAEEFRLTGRKSSENPGAPGRRSQRIGAQLPEPVWQIYDRLKNYQATPAGIVKKGAVLK